MDVRQQESTGVSPGNYTYSMHSFSLQSKTSHFIPKDLISKIIIRNCLYFHISCQDREERIHTYVCVCLCVYIYVYIYMYIYSYSYIYMGFLCSSVSKESACSAGDLSSIPG